MASKQATTRVLVVEDESALIMTLTDMLKGAGFDVEILTDGATASDHILKGDPDIVLLDVMLPGASGFDICKTVREKGFVNPILMLTARGDISDKVRGLRIGADDYLTKPFDPRELIARLEALRRRVDVARDAHWVQLGDVRVDLRKGRVFRSGAEVELSEREFAVLQYLIEKRGAVVSREELLGNVWGWERTPITRTVDVHIGLLRQKLERDPRNPEFIVTVHMRGYRLMA